jgi:leader peptidase (prepilin peptidase)/N-methyltransferase
MNINDAIALMTPGLYAYISFLVFWFGACMGSFLNVCIYRIPREESVVKPRSHCTHCNTEIPWYDNIPLVSFFVLRAQCRKCGGPISAWLVVFGLALGTFVDLEHMIIPDRVSLGGIVLGILFSTLIPELHNEADGYGGFLSAFLGAAIGVGILWLVAVLGKLIFRKDAMGMGDVKLMGAIGAFLGWPSVLFTLMVSSFLGAAVGITLVLTGKKAMQSRIPYGPYIALAALIWMLWGPTLWNAYINWLIPPQPL